MKFLLLPLFLLVFAISPAQNSLGDPGPFAVGYQDLTFTDNSLATPTVDIRVYYPATIAGANSPVAAGVFPRIAFGHGFNLNYLDYEDICNHLASYGYIIATPDVQNGFSVDHQEYARELAACLDYLESEGNNFSSDFYLAVDTMCGVFGHSMGGGASGLVPSVYPTIDAVSGLAAAETNPSAIAALANYAGPFQSISGEDDNTAPESGHQIPMYNAATGPRQWVSLTGGAHCKFTDATTICDLVSSPGSISRPTQIHRSNKYLVAFFNYFLKADASAETYICGDSVQADITASRLLNSTELICNVVGVEMEKATVMAYPNPFQGRFWIEEPGSYRVVDGQGSVVWEGHVEEKTEVDGTQWSRGLYWLVEENGRGRAMLRE